MQSLRTDVTEMVKRAAVRGVPAPSARSERRGVRGPALGKDRKSTSKPSDTLSPEQLEHARHSQRVRRYKLQRTAAELVGGSVVGCGRYRHHNHQAGAPFPVVKGEDGSAHVGGLQRCGNVWVCPVCAARIANQRRVECIHALKQQRAVGHHVYMLTLTLPHRAGQSLKAVLNALSKATTALNSGRNSMKAVLEDFGYMGQIRSAEVTYGANGWHPHLHVLVLTTMPVQNDDPVIDVLRARWEAAVVAQGWAAPGWHCGATWQDGSAAAQYVNKEGTWGMAEEISSHTSKKGTNGGRTPSELLQDAALGDDQAAVLFKEYAAAFKGRRQQFWSRGLKSYFGVAELSDQDIAEGLPESADSARSEVVAEVYPADWFLLVQFQQQAELLRAAEVGGQVAVDFLISLTREKQVAELKRNANVTRNT